MKTSISVRLILLVAVIAAALNKGFDALVEFKMNQMDKERQALREQRSDINSTLLKEIKETEATYHELKHRAVAKANKALDKTSARKRTTCTTPICY